MPRNLRKEYQLHWNYIQTKNDELLDKMREYRKDCMKYKQAQNFLKNCDDPYSDLAMELREVRQPTRQAVHAVRNWDESNIIMLEHPDDITNEGLNDFYNIIPFNRCIMINISPDWKGKLPDEDLKWTNKFIRAVMSVFYKNCNRFTKMKYVIECGSEGNFIHVHAVLELNPAMSASNKQCIRKGNLLNELRKCWDRVAKYDNEFDPTAAKGYVGLLKGRYALQSTLINTEQIRCDKLDYLIEDLKPESHRNAPHTLYPIVVGSWD